MKKHFSPSGLILMSLLAGLFLIPAASQARAAFGVISPRLSEVVSMLHTPEEIAGYMWRNFRIESDQAQFGTEEYWQTPDELLSNRSGDCEDFARFALEILKARGVSAWLVNVYGSRFAHTVCVFKENGYYHIIDGTEVKRVRAEGLQDVFTAVYPYWKSGAIVHAPAGAKQGRILKQIHRSSAA